MPLLGSIRLSETEQEAVHLVLDGRMQYWRGVVVARYAADLSRPNEASGTTPDESAALPTDKKVAARKQSAKQRREAVDAYIEEARRAGVTINRTEIWRKAGYKTRSEFERWERNDPRATRTADANITRILTEKPHLRKPIRSAKS
jgi:hypothetical protein